MTICPFCGHDPFHYVDNGVGMEAVAVTCCELGDQYFRGQRPTPEEVTLSREEFCEIAEKLLQARYEPSDSDWKIAVDCGASQFESYARRDELKTAEQRRNALDDAFQHTFGLLSLRRTLIAEEGTKS